MKRFLFLGIMAGWVLMAAGCAGMQDHLMGSGADSVAQGFFDDIQRSRPQAAYGRFAKGLSQVVTYDQFNQLLDTLKDQWGRLQSAQTAEMPFHRRLGESNFMPLHVREEEVKRYVYEVEFDHAQVNWDLTLALQEGQYRIIWMSLWGSTNYFTPPVREKIEALFSRPNETEQ